MKKWIAFAVTAAVASALYAAPAADQNAEAVKARQAQMLKGLQMQLGLSDQQTQQWGEIQERYMKAHMKLRVEQNNELNAMLTEEQRKKFEQMQQAFRERLQKRMGAAQ
jgi:Spy/CpxP family protein refolding chaperone